jgi:hypothetical protein
MDTVRFGRVLGSGARSAAKTLSQAIDAAKADNPVRPPSPAPVAEEMIRQGGDVRLLSRTDASAASSYAPRSTTRVVQQRGGVREGASRFRDVALKPFVRLSSVLVLEVVGVFFGIFALYGVNTMWRVHTSWHTSSPGYRQFVGGALMLAVFGYFCVTSFLRARRRERRR